MTAVTSDILWHNSSTGETQIWFMDGQRLSGRATVMGEDGNPAFVGLPWSIVGIIFDVGFEFGQPNIIWHNSSTNETQIWGMFNHNVNHRATVMGEDGNPAFVGPPWSIVGASDFNGNGKDDILWHNSSTGETQIWFMDGQRLSGRATVMSEDGSPAFVGPPWSIVGSKIFTRVHGAIGDKYTQLGGPNSWLGWPTSDEQPFDQGGRVSTFQNGAIYWWPDTGAIELGNIAVRYTGLACFGETDNDQLSTADEPYVIFGAVPVVPMEPVSTRTVIYEDVDAGDSRTDNIELYRGLPYGLSLTVVLMEHDFSDPDQYRDLIKSGVAAASAAVTAAVGIIPFVGPFLAVGAGSLLAAVGPAITDEIKNILDTEDDHIGSVFFVVTAKDMVTMARRPRQDFRAIQWHMDSPLISGDGASYKVYIDIQAV